MGDNTNLPDSLQAQIEDAVRKVLTEFFGGPVITDRTLIYGLNGLRRFLNCSQSTAQRIAASGKIPSYQDKGVMIFDASEVLQYMRIEPGTVDTEFRKGRGRKKKEVSNG
jgi:hypothetical protein